MATAPSRLPSSTYPTTLSNCSFDTIGPIVVTGSNASDASLAGTWAHTSPVVGLTVSSTLPERAARTSPSIMFRNCGSSVTSLPLRTWRPRAR
jgi:hypothetical protein